MYSVTMSSPPVELDESLCLCREFVPEGKRVDVQQIVRNDKTGKREWKTLMRAHQDCPFHGIKVTVMEACPED